MTPPLKIFKPGKAPKGNEYLITKQALIKHQPLTRRQLSKLTGLEISSLCRILYHLTYQFKVIKVAFYKRCEYTGMRVMHFAMKDWEEQKHE